MYGRRVRLRFGYCVGPADEPDALSVAQRAEKFGFDTVLVSDHVGPGNAPMVTLAAIARATERIRIGTFVLNNDMRNVVQLAWETATLDRLSGGRLELGLGAGHTPQEYAATGIERRSPAARKRRLCEAVEVMRMLLAGEPVTYDGEFVHVSAAQIDAGAQARVPILVGGNGAALLEHAGEYADIVGLQGLGRTSPDGHMHAVRWQRSWLDEQLDQVRRGSARRRDGVRVELNALVQVTAITDDAPRVYAKVCERIDGLDAQDARQTPYLLVGTVDEIAAKIMHFATEYGITYFAVRALDDFAPVIQALR
jgi:probable F420-dependent oxidoreductase